MFFPNLLLKAMMFDVFYLSVYYSLNRHLILFKQNALRISSNVPGAKVLVQGPPLYIIFSISVTFLPETFTVSEKMRSEKGGWS